MFSFLRSRPGRQEKETLATFEKLRVAALETAFGVNFTHLREVFDGTPERIKEASLAAYPGAVWLGNLGIKAFVQIQAIESSHLHAYLNLTQDGRQSPAPRHFVSEPDEEYVRHALLSTKAEFAGEMAYLITNDLELLKTLTSAGFNPPAPWVAFPECGPMIFNLQGDAQYWFENMWDPYWESLSLAEQSDFLTMKKPDGIADWADWVDAIRTRDPRYREQLKQEYRHEK